MKLLVITRKVDAQDERMGFFVDWLNQFTEKTDQLYVISLQAGRLDGLADNAVVSFIQPADQAQFDRGFRLASRVTLLFKYWLVLLKYLPKVDGVFVHMMPRYVNWAGWLVKLFRRPLVFWYTHGTVDRQLKATEKWVTAYITASQSSFRLQTKRPVYVLGHGINLDKFKSKNEKIKAKDDYFKILTVGRISPSKGLETLIEAVKLLVTSYSPRYSSGATDQLPFKCLIIGAPALHSDEAYLKKLKQLVVTYRLENNIKFLGPKPHHQVSKYYQEADVLVNLSSTGSLDKAVLEAMASGTLVLTSNEAFKEVLGDLMSELMFAPDDDKMLTNRLQEIYNMPQSKYSEVSKKLIRIVEQKHKLENLIDNIVSLFK